MALTKKEKATIIDKFKTSKEDKGSPEVQVALLSAKIKKLSEHLSVFKKDNHSRRGLLQMVGQRRKLLSYLKDRNEDRYKALISALGLKK